MELGFDRCSTSGKKWQRNMEPITADQLVYSEDPEAQRLLRVIAPVLRMMKA